MSGTFRFLLGANSRRRRDCRSFLSLNTKKKSEIVFLPATQPLKLIQLHCLSVCVSVTENGIQQFRWETNNIAQSKRSLNISNVDYFCFCIAEEFELIAISDRYNVVVHLFV